MSKDADGGRQTPPMPNSADCYRSESIEDLECVECLFLSLTFAPIYPPLIAHAITRATLLLTNHAIFLLSTQAINALSCLYNRSSIKATITTSETIQASF